MSFWLADPIKLIDDVNILPSESQPYEERMNTLTRLVIFIAAVLYLLKTKGSVYFLLFGVILIIILYYSQREGNRQKMSSQASKQQQEYQDLRENFKYPIDQQGVGYQEPSTSPSAPTETPELESVWYDLNSGPPRPEYWRTPVIAPSMADPLSWGGFDSRINTTQPAFMHTLEHGYDSKISWDDSSRSFPTARMAATLPPGASSQGRALLQPMMTQSQQGPSNPVRTATFNNPPGTTALPIVSSARNPLGARQGTPEPRNVNTPFSLGVPGGQDDRFIDNDFYVYNRTVSDPSVTNDYVQPINQGGYAHDPAYRNTYDSSKYFDETPPSWDPMYVGEARTLYQRELYPDDKDDRTGPVRVRSTLGMALQPNAYNSQYEGGSGDPFRALPDLPGNNQYYYTNVDPFENMFAIRSEAAHMDMLYPNGKIVPQYRRDGVEIEDYIEAVANRQNADELFFRDSLVEAARAKFMENELQYRMAPMRGYAGQRRMG